MKVEMQFAPDTRPAPVRAAFLTAVAVAVVVAGFFAVYWQTVSSIEAIWRRSETFAHGYVVVPIVAWLIWRKRAHLAGLTPQPFWPALALVAVFGFGWLVGELGGVLGAQQFSLLFMLSAALVTVLGLEISRRIAVPLAFLLFAVPFGEFLVPWLIDRTADFTVVALKASGVPVYREGNHLTIPTGHWSVVEACSGIRYLIASLMVGTLFAYLMYRSMSRRIAFILISIVVPIVANWVRAYMIVMIGHLTDNQFAVGLDHLVYGWLFFGVVILIMFWIGARWREDEWVPGGSVDSATRGPVTAMATGPVLLATVAVLVFGIAWRPLAAVFESHSHVASAALTPIGPQNGWTAAPEPKPAWKPHFLGARSELHQWFAKNGQVVGVYVALYSQQSQGSELIGHANQLVAPENSVWVKQSETRAPISWEGFAFAARAAEITGSAHQIAARQWYWINDEYTASDTAGKLLLVSAKLSLRPDHSAVIVVYAPGARSASGAAQGIDAFANDMAAPIMASLRQAASH